MQVDGEIAVCARGNNEIGKQTRRDRRARLVFFVAAPVGIIRDDSRDTTRGGALERINKDQQFHYIRVDGMRQPLDQKHIVSAHALSQMDENIAVRKIIDFGFGERTMQFFTDGFGQRTISASAKNNRGTVKGVHFQKRCRDDSANRLYTAVLSMSLRSQLS